MRINNLEIINTAGNSKEQRNNGKKETDKEVKQKKSLYSSVTKKDNETEKRMRLSELESKQREIMDNIINLEPSTSNNKLNENTVNKQTNVNEKLDLRQTEKILETKISENKEKNHDSEWQTVKSGRKYNGFIKQNKISKGQPDPGTALSKLKVVKRLSWIFLSNFDIEMTPNDILECIDEKYREQCECEKLETRFKEVASFKLGVPFYAAKELGSINYWPEGIKVGAYKFTKKTQEQEVNFTVNRTTMVKI